MSDDKPWLFKPGVVQNPNGRPPDPPEIRELKVLTRTRYNKVVNKIFQMNTDEIKKFLEESEQPGHGHNSLDVLIARQVYYCMSRGDPGKFEAILGRMIGIPARSVHLTGEDGGPIDLMVTKLTPEERDAEILRLTKLDQELGND